MGHLPVFSISVKSRLSKNKRLKATTFPSLLLLSLSPVCLQMSGWRTGSFRAQAMCREPNPYCLTPHIKDFLCPLVRPTPILPALNQSALTLAMATWPRPWAPQSSGIPITTAPLHCQQHCSTGTSAKGYCATAVSMEGQWGDTKPMARPISPGRLCNLSKVQRMLDPSTASQGTHRGREREDREG